MMTDKRTPATLEPNVVALRQATDQTMHTVLLCKAFEDFFLMLNYSSVQVTSNSNMKNPVYFIC